MNEPKENSVLLPKGFEETNHYITYDDGHTILSYCISCTKKSSCLHNKYLREAMGENYPFWSKKFIIVKCYPDKNWPFHSHETTFCEDYESLQTKLPFPSFCDGVLKLIEETILRYNEE